MLDGTRPRLRISGDRRIGSDVSLRGRAGRDARGARRQRRRARPRCCARCSACCRRRRARGDRRRRRRQSLTPVERARRLAYVPQQHVPPFAFTVEDVVLMGRAARVSAFARPVRADRTAAAHALARLGIAALAQRAVTELSGGERQLVLIARALAQDTPLLVLDEPTASLDFGNRARVLRELDRLRGCRTVDRVLDARARARARARRPCAAARWRRRRSPCGDAAAALTAENVSRLYGLPVQLVDGDGDAQGVRRRPRG